MKRALHIALAALFGAGAAAQESTEFDSYDRNNDGVVDRTEVQDEEYLRENFAKWDVDGDGLIDVNDVYEMEDDRVVWDTQAFNEYDLDDDGYLDEEEAGRNDYVAFSFEAWDENDDNLLSLGEVEDTWYEDEATR